MLSVASQLVAGRHNFTCESTNDVVRRMTSKKSFLAYKVSSGPRGWSFIAKENSSSQEENMKK